LTDLLLSLTIVTEASTPSSADTVTGTSTATPTAPSVTEALSLGTSRSANGVPLSKMTFAGGALPPLPQAPTLSAATGTISAVGQDRYRHASLIQRPTTAFLPYDPPTLHYRK
jgi:hypothetical protein